MHKAVYNLAPEQAIWNQQAEDATSLTPYGSKKYGNYLDMAPSL